MNPCGARLTGHRCHKHQVQRTPHQNTRTIRGNHEQKRFTAVVRIRCRADRTQRFLSLAYFHHRELGADRRAQLGDANVSVEDLTRFAAGPDQSYCLPEITEIDQREIFP